MRDTTLIGNQTEGLVLAALLQAGHSPLLPFGDGHRYDLAFDDNGTLQRVQCKTGRIFRGSVIFNTMSHTGHQRKPYDDEVDFFGVYCPDTNDVYLVPIDDVAGLKMASLRVDPARNNQAKGVRWAKDYTSASFQYVPHCDALSAVGSVSHRLVQQGH